MLCHKEIVQFVNRQRNSTSLPNVLKENLFSDIAGLVFKAKSRFYFPFNKAISQLFEGGLTSFWRNNYYELNKRNLFQPDSGPKVFSMDHLAVSFYIWLGFLAISSISFLIETVTARCHRRLLLWLYVMRGDKFKGKSFGLKCAWQYHSIIHEDEGKVIDFFVSTIPKKC